MNNKRYYGLAGVNGYGVYNDHYCLARSVQYVKGVVINSFDSFIDANKWAREQFFARQAPEFYDKYYIVDLGWLNWTNYRRRLIRGIEYEIH